MSETMDPDEIERNLPDGWELEGDEIVGTYEFDDYLDGVAFAVEVGELAEEKFHHPEIVIGYEEVEIRLTTHEAGGVTEADVEMAELIDEL